MARNLPTLQDGRSRCQETIWNGFESRQCDRAAVKDGRTGKRGQPICPQHLAGQAAGAKRHATREAAEAQQMVERAARNAETHGPARQWLEQLAGMVPQAITVEDADPGYRLLIRVNADTWLTVRAAVLEPPYRAEHTLREYGLALDGTELDPTLPPAGTYQTGEAPRDPLRITGSPHLDPDMVAPRG